MQKLFYFTKLLKLKRKIVIPFTIFEGQFDLIKYKKKIEKKKYKNLKYKSLFSCNLKNLKNDTTIYNFKNFKNRKLLQLKWYKKKAINHLWFFKNFYFFHNEKKYKKLLNFLCLKKNYLMLLGGFSYNNYINYNYYFTFFWKLKESLITFCIYKLTLIPSMLDISYKLDLNTFNMWNNIYYNKDTFAYNYLFGKKKKQQKEVQYFNRSLLHTRKWKTNYIFPYFLKNIRSLIGSHFKKNNIFNIKKYNMLYKCKYNINLLLFSKKKKKLEKKLNKFNYFYKFMLKWFYFQKFLFVKKNKYSIYLLKKYYFFIFFVIRLLSKVMLYFMFICSKINIFKNLYKQLLKIKLLLFYTFYKNSLKGKMAYKNMILYKNKKCKYLKNIIKKNKAQFNKLKKKYFVKHKGKFSRKQIRKNFWKKYNPKIFSWIIGKKYGRYKFFSIKQDQFYFNIWNILHFKKNKKFKKLKLTNKKKNKIRILRYSHKIARKMLKKIEVKKMIKRSKEQVFSDLVTQVKTTGKVLTFLPLFKDLFKLKIFKSKLSILRKAQRKKLNTKLYLQRKLKREKRLKDQLKLQKLHALNYKNNYFKSKYWDKNKNKNNNKMYFNKYQNNKQFSKFSNQKPYYPYNKNNKNTFNVAMFNKNKNKNIKSVLK